MSEFTETRGHARTIVKKILRYADQLLSSNPEWSVGDFIELYNIRQSQRIPGLGQKSAAAVTAAFNAAGITLRQTT